MRRKQFIFLWFLMSMFGIILIAGFFHNHQEILDHVEKCPICTWERSFLALTLLCLITINIVFVFLFFLIDGLKDKKRRGAFTHFKSRAPPNLRGVLSYQGI